MNKKNGRFAEETGKMPSIFDNRPKWFRIQALVLTVVTVGCLIAGPVIAGAVDTLMQKHAMNRLKPTKITVSVEEDRFDSSPNENGVVTKHVQVVNGTGPNAVAAYVRVTLVPHWVNSAGQDVLGSVSSSDLRGLSISGNSFTVGGLTYVLAEDWAEHWFYNGADGCFYYREALAPGAKTTYLLKEVQIDKAFADAVYPGKNVAIDVLTDSVQTEGGAVAKLWGASIAALLPDL